MNPKIGQGFDAHKLVSDRRLVLGGVEIPFDRGLEGHSDGDVLLHAVCDAILGAMGEGDLGRHFPSSDESLRGIDSAILLERVVEMMRERSLELGNLDATLIAQVPRLAPHQAEIQKNLASLLGSPQACINLKVTSTDHIGALGREEGMAALVVVLLVARGGEWRR
ncbi:MAG: 2-C-methyl-D-erythritol 2,4-cyclodiphosphate synthase [Myxococcales bacterium]|nr:2-C-methyl-D-erythritol 2,4-cyclodiphosphate synthase [Myxococcales bacterium]